MQNRSQSIVGKKLPTILLVGVDSLTLTTHNIVNKNTLDRLSEAKKSALFERKEVFAGLPRAGGGEVTFAVQPNGARGFTYLANNESFDFAVCEFPAGNGVAAKIEFRSRWLWLHDGDTSADWTSAVEQVLDTVNAWFTSEDGAPVQWQVSRVDLCVDVQGWFPSLTEIAAVVKKSGIRGKQEGRLADVVNDERDDKTKIWDKGKGLETVQFGRGNIILRVYDKSLEISESSKKWWFLDLWKKHEYFKPLDRVTRVEFQVRREALKSFEDRESGVVGVNTLDDLKRSQKSLWAYLTQGWISFRVAKRGDVNRSRWPVLPAWKAIADVAHKVQPLVRVGTKRLRDVEELLPAFRGYAATIAALLALDARGSMDRMCEAVLGVAIDPERLNDKLAVMFSDLLFQSGEMPEKSCRYAAALTVEILKQACAVDFFRLQVAMCDKTRNDDLLLSLTAQRVKALQGMSRQGGDLQALLERIKLVHDARSE